LAPTKVIVHENTIKLHPATNNIREMLTKICASRILVNGKGNTKPSILHPHANRVCQHNPSNLENSKIRTIDRSNSSLTSATMFSCLGSA